jgi:adenosylcobyric acid synthase
LEAEDAISRDGVASGSSERRLRVIVPVLPRISNHTDFDPLRLHPQLDFCFVGPGDPLPAADLIILPGSKSVRADLAFMRAQGWDNAIRRHLRYGGKLMGICGGFQMLGRWIHDPQGIEGAPGSCAGLGWLHMETTLMPHKQLRTATGTLAGTDVAVHGYEIHAGICAGRALDRPALLLGHGPDGARSEDEDVFGTYLHGLFDLPSACDALLAWAGLVGPTSPDIAALREASLDRLADAVSEHLDGGEVLRILEASGS